MERKRPVQQDNASEGNEDTQNAPLRPQTGPPEPRPAALTELKAGEPRESDEPGDVSLQNADNPTLVREEVANSSTSSGTHAGDEGDDQVRKDLLRRGAREVSRMD